VPNFIKIGQTIAEMWRVNGFSFKTVGRPTSGICWARIGTTHSERLVVSILVQHLVEMMRWFRQYETSNILPVWRENAYSRPKNWGKVGGISPPKWGGKVNETPNRHTLAQVRVVVTPSRCMYVGRIKM